MYRVSLSFDVSEHDLNDQPRDKEDAEHVVAEQLANMDLSEIKNLNFDVVIP